MAKSEFGKRLKQIFNNATNQEIANIIGVSAPAVQHYVNGRVPDAEKLITIAAITKCNLHWLITGEGSRLAVSENNAAETPQPDPLIDRKALAAFVREVIREELTDVGGEIKGVEPKTSADFMLSRNIGKVDGGEEEEKVRKTG